MENENGALYASGTHSAPGVNVAIGVGDGNEHPVELVDVAGDGLIGTVAGDQLQTNSNNAIPLF